MDLAFLRHETSPRRRLDAERVEEVVAHQHPDAHVARAVARSGEAGRRDFVGDEAVERAGRGPQVAIVRIGERAAEKSFLQRLGIDRDDGAGVADG